MKNNFLLPESLIHLRHLSDVYEMPIDTINRPLESVLCDHKVLSLMAKLKVRDSKERESEERERIKTNRRHRNEVPFDLLFHIFMTIMTFFVSGRRK
jgi:uncharacterized ParB-like nuclease family protein